MGDEYKTQQSQEQQGGGGQTPPRIRHVKKVVNKQKAMSISFSKPMLETAEDVEEHVALLKEQLLDYIRQNKNIMLN